MTSNNENLQVNLEAFQINLHGGRILLQGPFSDKKPPILDAVQNIREPFKKNILITSHPVFFTNFIEILYDTCFHPINSLDWSLCLNYLQHLTNTNVSTNSTGGNQPILVVVEDLDIPDGFFLKLQNNKKITLIHKLNYPIKFKSTSMLLYDSIFFPFQSDLGAQQVSHIYATLQNCYRSSWSHDEFRDIMTEIRAAGAGLCWTKMDDNKNGSIYWYDPVSILRNYPLKKKELSEILMWTANQL